MLVKVLYGCVILALALPAAASGHMERQTIAGVARRAQETPAHFHARLYHHGVTWERWARHHRPLYRSPRKLRRALRDARWLQRRFAPAKPVVVRPMLVSSASWYGPGFYGNRTACGVTLTTATIGVANRTLPCFTRIEVCHAGRCLVAPVIDRGPFVYGREFDLSGALAVALRFGGVDTVAWRIL